MIAEALVSSFDVYIWGVFTGGLLVVVAGFVDKQLKLFHKKKSMELDLTLGRALEAMQDRLNSSKPKGE